MDKKAAIINIVTATMKNHEIIRSSQFQPVLIIINQRYQNHALWYGILWSENGAV